MRIIGAIFILIAAPFVAIFLAIGMIVVGIFELLFGERTTEHYPWEKKFWL